MNTMKQLGVDIQILDLILLNSNRTKDMKFETINSNRFKLSISLTLEIL